MCSLGEIASKDAFWVSDSGWEYEFTPIKDAGHITIRLFATKDLTDRIEELNKQSINGKAELQLIFYKKVKK